MTLILSGTDGLSDVDGSAATPAIRGTDTNTGIFFPAADTIAFSEGGVESMRIDSSGNVGIGTASPAVKLDVVGAINATGAIRANGVTTDIYPLVSGTAQNSTSGTSIDFTSIPSWVKRITVMFNGVSTNGTSQVQVQLGSGTVKTTGYRGSVETSATTVSAATITTGLALERTGGAGAANSRNGIATFVLIGSNIWSGVAQIGYEANQLSQSACAVTLSGTLDRVRITTVNGTDTFDAGSINILYE